MIAADDRARGRWSRPSNCRISFVNPACALEVYHHARRSGEGAGLDELIERMGKRFRRNRRTSKTEAQQSPPATTGAAGPGHLGLASIRASHASKCKTRGKVRKARAWVRTSRGKVRNGKSLALACAGRADARAE